MHSTSTHGIMLFFLALFSRLKFSPPSNFYRSLLGRRIGLAILPWLLWFPVKHQPLLLYSSSCIDNHLNMRQCNYGHTSISRGRSSSVSRLVCSREKVVGSISVLGARCLLVGLVSVKCDWLSQKSWSLRLLRVWQHVKLSTSVLGPVCKKALLLIRTLRNQPTSTSI